MNISLRKNPFDDEIPPSPFASVLTYSCTVQVKKETWEYGLAQHLKKGIWISPCLLFTLYKIINNNYKNTDFERKVGLGHNFWVNFFFNLINTFAWSIQCCNCCWVSWWIRRGVSWNHWRVVVSKSYWWLFFINSLIWFMSMVHFPLCLSSLYLYHICRCDVMIVWMNCLHHMV